MNEPDPGAVIGGLLGAWLVLRRVRGKLLFTVLRLDHDGSERMAREIGDWR